MRERRAYVVLAGLSLLAAALSLLAGVHYEGAQLAALRRAVLASCAFAADIGSVPVPDRPRPSKLGVQLVADSRAQWRELGCPGRLPVPPGFAHWALVYHLPSS